MSNLANATDVRATWRLLSGEEVERAQRLCEEASAMVRAQFRTIDDRIAADEISAVLVRSVVVGMVIRAMGELAAREQSRGVRQKSVGSVALTFDTAESSGGAPVGYLRIAPDELALLRPRSSSGFGTANLGMSMGYSRC